MIRHIPFLFTFMLLFCFKGICFIYIYFILIQFFSYVFDHENVVLAEPNETVIVKERHK